MSNLKNTLLPDLKMASGDTMTQWEKCLLCKHEDLNEGLVPG